MANNKIDIVLAVDPGAHGALCILLSESPVVIDTPTIEIKKNNKKHIVHDPVETKNLLKPFAGQNVLFALEKVSARPGEGVVSAFSFATSYAFWKMASICFDFTLVEYTPAVWKKFYPELGQTNEMVEIRDSIKALKAQSKLVQGDKRKEEVRKEISSLSRKLKTISKDGARALASSLYPEVEDRLKLKKHDGRAEALLLARYAKIKGEL